MSGICGIANLDGTSVDRGLLQIMTLFMTFRGPDAQDVWVDGPVGFGHTLLCTTFESEREHQPCSLDGRVWITADARIDGRAELKSKLLASQCGNVAEATDIELILHAYHVWDTNCVQHLIGDFAFAIWDGHKKRLFCARDHFGIKPFFYAQLDRHLIFSNTFNCVRKHPGVSDKLNDLAVADFLLFGDNKEPTSTVFVDIQRLLPAHVLTWSAGAGLKVKRYWSLPTDLGVRHRTAGDYVERFKELLDTAVADRLRTNRVGLEMSGGLDSSSIASVALRILSQQQRAFQLQAQTVVYDYLIPDQERYYSSVVAKHLGIPVHYIAADNYQLFEKWEHPKTWFPEPIHQPQALIFADACQNAASFGRVSLTGWDGDALLSESLRPHLRSLLHKRQYLRLFRELLRYAASQRQFLPSGWQKRLIRRSSSAGSSTVPDDGYPDWLNPEFETRLDLRNRWRQHSIVQQVDHSTRPYAYRSYQSLLQCTSFFENYDAGSTGLPLEYRHPLLDLRLLDYCLSLPLQPWLIKKHILRLAMRGVLPEVVRMRPKSPLAGFPHIELLKTASLNFFNHLPEVSNFVTYIDRAKLKCVQDLRDYSDLSWDAMRPFSFLLWLETVQVVNH